MSKSARCPKCGQVDVGQQGEFPCSVCDLPTQHDREYEGAIPPATDEEKRQQVPGNFDSITRIGDHRFAVLSLPLPSDHWLTAEGEDIPPMPFRLGTDDSLREWYQGQIVAACRYAVRATTNNGTIADFDPDAMCQNMVVGMLGYHTPNGLSSDESQNPQSEMTADDKEQSSEVHVGEPVELNSDEIAHPSEVTSTVVGDAEEKTNEPDPTAVPATEDATSAGSDKASKRGRSH